MIYVSGRRRRAPASSMARCVWVEPHAVGEAQYNELMQGRLRDAVLRGVDAM
jgi:hypothetical protein